MGLKKGTPAGEFEFDPHQWPEELREEIEKHWDPRAGRLDPSFWRELEEM